MPSKSKAQQRFFGVVKGIQKGKSGEGKAKKAADTMSKKDVDDFASTKHKGLPNKVKREQRVRQLIRKMVREIMAENKLKEAYRSQSIFFDKKDKSKLQKLLKKNKGKFPFNPPGESVVNWSLNDRGSKGLEWGGIPKAKYNKAVEFFMKNKLNPRG